MTSPLGKYQPLGAFLLALLLVVGAMATHAMLLATGQDQPITFLDAAAALAIGAVYGQQSAANGYAAEATAAHVRLDAIGAPPAGVVAVATTSTEIV